MHQMDLLPGALGPESVPAVSVYRPHEFIRQARRQVAFRQWTDAAALLMLDGMVMYWEQARLPFTSREMSVALVALANAGFLAWYLWLRKIPEWRARRVASSWRPEERKRLDETQRKIRPL